MKKFYLKISILVFIVVFAAIPAAAAEGLDYLLKTKEEKDLAIACDSGNGKYSACTKLVEILSKKCDDGDYESCGSLGAVLLVTMGRYKDSVLAFEKACEADMMYYCFLLAGNEIFYGGNIYRAIGYFDKVCYGKESDKKDFSCKIKEQLEICLSDSECNPLRKAVSILVPE